MFNENLDAVHFKGRTTIRRDDLALDAGCEPGMLGASDLLLAALAACLGATLEPLLTRHDVDESVHIAVRGGAQLLAVITLPRRARNLQERCERAAARCPVARALAIPVVFEWKFRE